MRFYGFASGLASMALVSAALAHSGATGIVKQRMDLMSQLGKDAKALSGMARDQVDIDWQRIEQAGAHATKTGEHFPKQFPQDSFKAPSEALETILTDGEAFTAQSELLAQAGLELQSAAESQDTQAFKQAFGTYISTCKTCHDTYRAQD